MASEHQSLPLRATSSLFRGLSRSYIGNKKPVLIAVAGSVGKTSTKLALARVLGTEKKVSCMDDSYNYGLGLYLSVFELKVPTSLKNPFAWFGVLARALAKFLQPGPEILILEYGIDNPGDMDVLVEYARPDYAVLTAVTPEHMEFLKDMDTVGAEETKVLHAAKKSGFVNSTDIDPKYLAGIQTELFRYGARDADATYEVKKWTRKGAEVDFVIGGKTIDGVKVQFISEPLIRQLCGTALVAARLGLKPESVRTALESVTPAASRMRVFDGLNESVIIDDTTNFSPVAGVEALKALKRLPADRRVAILGNMHELGDFAEQGFKDVSKEFGGLDMLILVGDLSKEYFAPLAKEKGFKPDETLFEFDDSPSAGIFMREKLQPGDTVLVKGPFGGFFLEEAVKKLLKDPADSKYVTRQSDFWQRKKRAQFGDLLDK